MILNFKDFDQVPSPSMYCNALYITRTTIINDNSTQDNVEENDDNDT